ncbi:MAG: VTT domain-containing protein [Mariprofundaceae bacterium]
MEYAQQLIEQYGYWALFAGTFAEGEVIFIAAAALAAAGLLETWKVIVVAAMGAFIGHLFFFAIGRWRGMTIINAVPTLKKHYPKANKVLDHYAHWSIFIFQYLYGTRLVAAILFGCSSISFWRFFFLQIINCITWAIVIYLAGHFLGIAAMEIMHRFGIWGLVLTFLMLVTIGILSWLRLRRHHAPPNTDEES